MVSKSKLYSKLDALETELRERLVPHLINAAKGMNDQIFCVKQFNSFRKPKIRTDKVTEELIVIGSDVLSLRQKLGESCDGTIAERICWYCRQWSSAKNNDKLLAASLAKTFLLEIESE